MMPGLSWPSLKKHYSLIPLFTIVGAGVLLAGGYGIRLALKSPDVSWRKKTNPEPWQEYANKRYKFYQTRELDTKRIEKERPVF